MSTVVYMSGFLISQTNQSASKYDVRESIDHLYSLLVRIYCVDKKGYLYIVCLCRFPLIVLYVFVQFPEELFPKLLSFYGFCESSFVKIYFYEKSLWEPKFALSISV